MLALDHCKTGKLDFQSYTLDPYEVDEAGFSGVIDKARRYWIYSARKMYGPIPNGTGFEQRTFEDQWVRYRDLIETGDIEDMGQVDTKLLRECCASDPTSIVYALKVINDLTVHLPALRGMILDKAPHILNQKYPNRGIPSITTHKGLKAMTGMRGPGVWDMGAARCNQCIGKGQMEN